MHVPAPPRAAAALAAFVCERLADVTGPLATLCGRGDAGAAGEGAAAAAPQQVAQLIVGAGPPFAPTAYARARLLRQMHGAGLLSTVPAEAVEGGTALAAAEVVAEHAALAARMIDVGS